MLKSSTIAMDIDVKVFDKKGGRLIYSTNAAMRKSDGNSFSILGEMEFIVTKEYDIQIDNEEKAILISKRDAQSKQLESINEQLKTLDVGTLKKLLQTDDELTAFDVNIVSDNDGMREYLVLNKKTKARTSILLDTHKNIIKSIKYEFNAETSSTQYVVLNYTKFDYDTDVSTHFDLKKYFSIVSGEYVLNAKFKDYHLYTEK